MAYDERLAERVRSLVSSRQGITEKRMFGGIAFLVRGNMSVGIVGDELMVRVGAAQHTRALARRHAREMDFTGRPMKGYVYVAAAALRRLDALRSWVDLGVRFARTLPPK